MRARARPLQLTGAPGAGGAGARACENAPSPRSMMISQSLRQGCCVQVRQSSSPSPPVSTQQPAPIGRHARARARPTPARQPRRRSSHCKKACVVTGIPACPSVLLEQQWRTGAAGRNAPAAKRCQQPTHTHKSLRQQDVATCPLCGSPLCGCRDKHIQIVRAASEATSYRRAACFMNGSTCQPTSNTTAGKTARALALAPCCARATFCGVSA